MRQPHLRSPRPQHRLIRIRAHRLAKEGIPDEEDQEAYRRSNAGLWGMVHGSLITNLAAPDPKIRNGSVGALASDANLAASLGLAGVCFHVGYCKGHETQDGAIEAENGKVFSGAA